MTKDTLYTNLYKPKLNRRETFVAKEKIYKSIRKNLRSKSIIKWEAKKFEEVISISLENPHRSINFDIVSSSNVYQLPVFFTNWLLNQYVENSSNSDSGFYVEYDMNKRDFFLDNNNYLVEKWISIILLDEDWTYKKGWNDFKPFLSNVIVSAQTILSDNKEKLNLDISKSDFDNIYDWKKIMHKYPFLNRQEIYLRLARNNKIMVFDNLDDSFYLSEEFSSVKKENNMTNTKVITYFNKVNNLPIVIGYVSSFDSKNTKKLINKKDAEINIDSLATFNLNIDGISMILLDKQHIEEVNSN